MQTNDLTIVVISHTDHYLDGDGQPCGWTSTVKELDFLAKHVHKVIHLAVLHPDQQAPKSVTPYAAKNVEFVPMPRYGGAGLRNKLRILGVLPQLLRKVNKLTKQADYFQFRAPTSIGVFLIPYLTFFVKSKGWYKYAGNWMQPNMPMSYKIQKWMFENMQHRPVTINGRWPDQKAHCFTFENPCLHEADLTQNKAATQNKCFDGPLEACFVGRLEDAKGVDQIIALAKQPGMEKKIQRIHLVGDGPQREVYAQQAREAHIEVVFHGFCPREKVFEFYTRCHLFLLPSKSEGFPKVIAEAAAFGCLPIVSDVSSIGQYVTSKNGFLWNKATESFTEMVARLDFTAAQLKNKQKNIYKLAEKFTFEHYLHQLQQHVWKVTSNQ